MNIEHHVSDALLMRYAAGGLGEAWSLAIATHAALCPICRDAIAQAEAVGGALVDEIEPAPMAECAFNDIMGLLDAEDAPAPVQKPMKQNVSGGVILPEPLRSYVQSGDAIQNADLPWQRLGLGAYHIPIAMSDRSAAARLLRIPAGRPVPEHGHGGLELTLVLSGAFTDGEAHFDAGDIQEADEALTHQPHAVAGEDCICLAVTDAPLRFSSPIVRLMQPLLKI